MDNTPPSDAIFVNVEPEDFASIKSLVQKGFIVTASADKDTVEARASVLPSECTLCFSFTPSACFCCSNLSDKRLALYRQNPWVTRVTYFYQQVPYSYRNSAPRRIRTLSCRNLSCHNCDHDVDSRWLSHWSWWWLTKYSINVIGCCLSRISQCIDKTNNTNHSALSNWILMLYSITSLSRTQLSRILDNPDKFWPPENQTQVIFTPVSRNLLKPDKKWPPEVSALTRDYCT